eukprot:TRINITY_DN1075_c0_g1_i1.p1 TRINITY_DN1075_c0_g1~~TRINITY_DN1075_c0_g1_i1.p1  ORF type:complete len:317 (+),score=83.49 TRINITY_DN1075_c0_g1_i1:449-1399(+)
MQFEDLDKGELPVGIIKKVDIKDVPTEPYPLPDEFKWVNIDVTTKEIEEVYALLSEFYIEDYDSSFRMKHSLDYFKWIFTPPGYHKDWAFGFRLKATNELVGFTHISPLKVSMGGEVLDAADASFAAVNTKYRMTGLAPLLIKEVNRRTALRNVWHYFMSTDRVLFAPFTETWFYRRELDFKTIMEFGVAEVPEGSTLEKEIELSKVPESANIPNLRPMTKEDIPQVLALLTEYLKKFTVHAVFTEEKIAHLLLPKEDIVYTYVIADKDNKATDFISFYIVTYSVFKHPTIKESKVLAFVSHRSDSSSIILPKPSP